MNGQQLALAVLEGLQEGIVPWRYPINVMPEFAPAFGKFFQGEPLAEANYTELDAIIKATGAKIIHNANARKARFHRHTDTIVLPTQAIFCDDRHYHATRVHEVLHFLENHRRLGWIGSDHQSELVCEIGTGFLESYLLLPNDCDNLNIVKWLPKWAEGIKANPRYLFDAVAQAELAVNYLIDLRRRKAA